MSARLLGVLAGTGFLAAVSCGGRTPLAEGEGSGSGGYSGTGGGVGGVPIITGIGGAAGTFGAGGSGIGLGGMAGAPIGAGGTFGKGGAAGAAGSIGAGGGIVGCRSGAAAMGCPNLPLANEDVVDNMNDGDPFIPPINGRAGAWVSYHDATPNAKMFPDGLFVMSETGDACRCSAARATGGIYTIWGSGFSVGLGGPYNASAYRGVSFWARSTAGPTVIRVALPDINTDPSGGRCDPTGGAMGCFDHWGSRIMLGTDWIKVTIPFSSLSQELWGNLAPAFRADAVYSIQFNISVGSLFDLWVDDVALIR